MAPYLAFGFFAVTFAVILFNALVWQKNRHSGPLLFSRVTPAVALKGPKNADAIAIPALARDAAARVTLSPRKRTSDRPRMAAASW